MFQKFHGQNTLRIRQKFTTWAMKLMPKYFLLTQMIRRLVLELNNCNLIRGMKLKRNTWWYQHKVIVQNLTQFGAFAELDEGIDGLIHVSDLSWTKVIKHPKEVVEKGDELEIKILEVSRDNRRISLGFKQLHDDPWPMLIEKYEAGNEASGEIIKILDKGIIIQLEDDVEGIIPFGKMSKKDRRSLAGNMKLEQTYQVS